MHIGKLLIHRSLCIRQFALCGVASSHVLQNLLFGFLGSILFRLDLIRQCKLCLPSPDDLSL